MTKKKIAYEWVLVMSKGEDIVLTENQYKTFKDNMLEAKVVFGDLGFSPSFVVQFFKRPAGSWMRDKYPCNDCNSTGRNQEQTEWCTACEGTGINI